MRSLVIVTAVVALAGGSAVHAQSGHRLSAELGAGLYVPNSLGSSDANGVGWLASGRLSLPARPAFDVFMQFTYSDAGDIGRSGTANDYVTIGLQEQMLAVGIDAEVHNGIRVEGGIGAASRRNTSGDVQGNPNVTFFPGNTPNGKSAWNGFAVLVPGLSWRSGDVSVRLRDMVILDDVTGNNNLSLMIGLRF